MIYELRDTEAARCYLLQGLCLQRGQPARAEAVRPALEWALEIVSGGEPLPPLGFVTDVGHAAFGVASDAERDPASPTLSAFPPGLARTYEDCVLGKLFADASFERAADALRRYQGRDRVRGLAFLIHQFRQRAGFGGVHLSPAVIKALL